MNILATTAAALLVAFSMAGIATATHSEGCVPESADAGDVTMVGDLYIEERDGDGTPGSGLTMGGGTWVYMESNGVPGLQRGGESVVLGELDADPVTDESCGHGPDTLLV